MNNKYIKFLKLLKTSIFLPQLTLLMTSEARERMLNISVEYIEIKGYVRKMSLVID